MSKRNRKRSPIVDLSNLEEHVIVFLGSDNYVRLEPVLLASIMRVQDDAVKHLEIPKPPTRMSKQTFGGSEKIEYTSLDELKGLEEDENYQELVNNLKEYNKVSGEYNTLRYQAVITLVFNRGIFPCDEYGENLDEALMIERLKSLAVEIADEKRLNYDYLIHWSTQRTQTVEELLKRVLLLSFPQEEEVQEVLSGFLDNIVRDAHIRVQN